MNVMSPLPVGESHREDAQGAVQEFHQIERYLAERGTNILSFLTGGTTAGQDYADEVWDCESNAQFFYHAHPDGGRVTGEHGHFHTFLGEAGMPDGIKPLILPEMGMAHTAPQRDEPQCLVTHRTRRDRGVFSHLIAISLDRNGRPLQLFTTNRWVTGETWYRADDVTRMLPYFSVNAETDRALLVGRWVSGLLSVLRPAVVELLTERDACMMDWRRRRTRSRHVFDDRRLEIMSSRMIAPRVLAR